MAALTDSLYVSPEIPTNHLLENLAPMRLRVRASLLVESLGTRTVKELADYTRIELNDYICENIPSCWISWKGFDDIEILLRNYNLAFNAEREASRTETPSGRYAN